MMSKESKFETWGIVDVMGHNRFAGLVSEQSIGGASFIRVDVPSVDNLPRFTKLLGASSIYAITPTTEEVARHVAAGLRAQPLTIYDLPQEIRDRLRSAPALPAPVLTPSCVDDCDWDEPDDSDYAE